MVSDHKNALLQLFCVAGRELWRLHGIAVLVLLVLAQGVFVDAFALLFFKCRAAVVAHDCVVGARIAGANPQLIQAYCRR